MDVKYDTETVKVIRGTEGMMISKREGDGWELVSQNPGKLRSELVFRRPRPKTPWRVLAIIGGVLVVLFISIGIMAALSNEDGDAGPAPVETSSAPAVTPSNEPPAEPEEIPDGSLPRDVEQLVAVQKGTYTVLGAWTLADEQWRKDNGSWMFVSQDPIEEWRGKQFDWCGASHSGGSLVWSADIRAEL